VGDNDDTGRPRGATKCDLQRHDSVWLSVPLTILIIGNNPTHPGREWVRAPGTVDSIRSRNMVSFWEKGTINHSARSAGSRRREAHVLVARSARMPRAFCTLGETMP